jgi:hypothetical protein
LVIQAETDRQTEAVLAAKGEDGDFEEDGGDVEMEDSVE